MTDTIRKSPRRSDMRKRQARPAMRCDPNELAQLEAAADRAGLTVGAFMRHQCLGTSGPRAVRRPTADRAVLAQLLAQLGRCSSNLNQIARALNSGGDRTDSEIDAAVADIRTAALAISRSLRGRVP